MLNQERYMALLEQKAVREKSSDTNCTALVTDPAVIAGFEKESGLTVGVLENPPYYNFCMDVYRAGKTDKLFRYCNVSYNRSGAAILVVLRTGEEKCFLLNRQYRPLLQKTVFEIPRGFADPDDPDAVSTAIRELAEETNIQIGQDLRLIRLGAVNPDSGLSNNEVVLFMAEICAEKLPALRVQDENETIIGHTIVSETEMCRMIAGDQITDAFTLAAFAKYRCITKE